MTPGIADAIPKLLPLIRLLASDKPGETSAAAAGIQRVLKANGADINDLATALAQLAHEDGATEADHWAALARRYLEAGHATLKERDREFLRNVHRSACAGRCPSHRQRKWMGDIAAKLELART